MNSALAVETGAPRVAIAALAVERLRPEALAPITFAEGCA